VPDLLVDMREQNPFNFLRNFLFRTVRLPH
jgi:hypothetical protein